MNESKNNFILGLAVGVAVVSLGGLIFMASKGNQTPQVNNNEVAKDQPSDKDDNNQPEKPTYADVKINDKDWSRGPKDAKVTIVEFSDIQCPYCSRHHENLVQLAKNYPKNIRWVYKHFPLDSLHPYARKAAEASECAGEQGKFWEYLDYLFTNQSSLNNEFLPTAAEKVGLDKNKFNTCLKDEKYKTKVEADYNQGLQAGVKGTPGNIINGQVTPGALPYSQLENIVKSKL